MSKKMHGKPQKKWFTVNDLAAEWGVSTNFVRREIAAGRLPAKRFAGSGVRGTIRVHEPEKRAYESHLSDAC